MANDTTLYVFMFLVDSSGSMSEQPIASVNAAMNECFMEMQDLNSISGCEVQYSVVTFDEDVKVLIEPEYVDFGQIPKLSIEPGPDGFYPVTKYSCLFDEFPKTLDTLLQGNSNKKGSVFVFLMTDGMAADSGQYTNLVDEAMKVDRFKNANRYVVITKEAGSGYGNVLNDVMSFVDNNKKRLLRLENLPDLFNQIRLDAMSRSGDDGSQDDDDVFGRFS